MTQEPSLISDADLMAYLDRALDTARAADLEARLAQDPEAQARLAEWQRQNALIGALYAPAAAEPVPPRLDVRRMAARRDQYRGTWLRMAATALLCLGLGSGAGWYLGTRHSGAPAGAERMALAVAAYRLYATDLVHPVQVEGDAEGKLGRWFAKRLDRPLTVPDLRPAGWSLVGGSLLPAGDGRAAQIMYESAEGQRMTLYFTKIAAGAHGSSRFDRQSGLDVMSWTDGALNCTIVAPVSRKEIKRLATMVYDQLS